RIEQGRWYARGLAGAGWRLEYESWMAREAREHLRQDRVDRQGRAGLDRHPRIVGGNAQPADGRRLDARSAAGRCAATYRRSPADPRSSLRVRTAHKNGAIVSRPRRWRL